MRHALNKEQNFCDKKPEGRVGWGKKAQLKLSD